MLRRHVLQSWHHIRIMWFFFCLIYLPVYMNTKYIDIFIQFIIIFPISWYMFYKLHLVNPILQSTSNGFLCNLMPHGENCVASKQSSLLFIIPFRINNTIIKYFLDCKLSKVSRCVFNHRVTENVYIYRFWTYFLLLVIRWYLKTLYTFSEI